MLNVTKFYSGKDFGSFACINTMIEQSFPEKEKTYIFLSNNKVYIIYNVKKSKVNCYFRKLPIFIWRSDMARCKFDESKRQRDWSISSSVDQNC